MIEIDKNVKITQHADGRGRPPKYPFATMKKGDSFFIPAENKVHVRKLANSITAAWRRHTPKEFSTRTQLKPLGLRVWRTK